MQNCKKMIYSSGGHKCAFGHSPSPISLHPPTPLHVTLSQPEWMLHSSRWPCFFASQSWMLINWEGCWVDLHSYHINTDKVACAKQARQVSAVNSQFDLRQSWMATEPGNKCIFHGRHVRARGEQTNTENKCSSSIDSLVWRVTDIRF